MKRVKRYALEETSENTSQASPQGQEKEEAPPAAGKPAESFATILEDATALFLDDVRKEVVEILEFSMESGFNYSDTIPDEMKFDGVCPTGSNGTRFFDDLLGDCRYEVSVYVAPLRDSLAEFGITAPRAPISEDIWLQWDDQYPDVLSQCEIVLTLNIHQLNYIFKGNLQKGEIIRQYWGD